MSTKIEESLLECYNVFRYIIAAGVFAVAALSCLSIGLVPSLLVCILWSINKRELEDLPLSVWRASFSLASVLTLLIFLIATLAIVASGVIALLVIILLLVAEPVGVLLTVGGTTMLISSFLLLSGYVRRCAAIS